MSIFGGITGGATGGGGGGSGGDAELLDGLDSTDFVRKTGAVAETVTGAKTFEQDLTVARTAGNNVAALDLSAFGGAYAGRLEIDGSTQTLSLRTINDLDKIALGAAGSDVVIDGNSGTFTLPGFQLKGLAGPTAASDAATKAYADAAAAPHGKQRFLLADSGSNYTVPAGVTKIWVTGCGGGGGGGVWNTLDGFGGGGGGAECAIATEIVVTPLDIHLVTIGAAGLGRVVDDTNGPGTAGGATSLGGLVSLAGGGAGGDSDGWQVGLSGGSGGGPGGIGDGPDGAHNFGLGGGGVFGSGGSLAINGGQLDGTGSGFGAGGGGNQYNFLTIGFAKSGDGSPGFLLVEW